jgi:hypothetical protein
MELLLILSAMLSAVTGAFAGVREPEARVHQAEAAVGAKLAAIVVQAQAPRALAMRPANVAPVPRIRALSEDPIPAAAPLYADRLIE